MGHVQQRKKHRVQQSIFKLVPGRPVSKEQQRKILEQASMQKKIQGKKGNGTMNKLTIIGNLTKDPELRTTQAGKNVCSFDVAVKRRSGQEETDYFRVSAWNGLADTCARYLAKGRKVCVVGPVSVHTYEDVEFLTPKGTENKAVQADDERPY